MEIKVNISFSMWPYTQSHEVSIPESEFKNMDTWVDSITNNIKMNLLTHVRTHHPNLWNQYTPHNVDKLADLATKEVSFLKTYKVNKTNL